MEVDQHRESVHPAQPAPSIEILKHADTTGPRLGVFASSFNPPTIAHVELIRRAAEAYSLDETLALAGRTNADKILYECPLEDRIAMLELTFSDAPGVSIGLSSHPFYIDMLEAIERVYPAGTDLHFIVGFDTFERVIDPEDRYTARYYRRFHDRVDALQHLFARCSFIVAGRGGSGLDHVKKLIEDMTGATPQRIAYLDFPTDLGEISATEARKRLASGVPIGGLVPSRVEEYILEHRLYGAAQ